MAKKKYDVLIVELKTGKVSAIIGTNLNEDRADKRIETGLSRINDDFFVGMYTAGEYKVGSKIK